MQTTNAQQRIVDVGEERMKRKSSREYEDEEVELQYEIQEYNQLWMPMFLPSIGTEPAVGFIKCKRGATQYHSVFIDNWRDRWEVIGLEWGKSFLFRSRHAGKNKSSNRLPVRQKMPEEQDWWYRREINRLAETAHQALSCSRWGELCQRYLGR
jgi:hypothetical protein